MAIKRKLKENKNKIQKAVKERINKIERVSHEF